MLMNEVVTASKIAYVYTESGSNKIPYLGRALFSPKKKMGLDLAWFKGHKGIPVTLKASAFDTVSTIRGREGIEKLETEMAYFKESMVVKEKDEQDVLRLLDSNDPYAPTVIANIFNDTNALLDGAEVVPERMIWQLLCPANSGKPGISISFDNATYVYDYDPNGAWALSNYEALDGTNAWSDTTNSTPIQDIQEAKDAVSDASGAVLRYAYMNGVTMAKLRDNASIHSMILAQNSTANIIVNNARVSAVMDSELQIIPVVYDKKFVNESGVTTKFIPDGYVVLAPEGELGNMYYGTTPAERAKLADPKKDIELYDGRVAIQVTISDDPAQTKTTVSEICLPSFERMDEVFVIKAF